MRRRVSEEETVLNSSTEKLSIPDPSRSEWMRPEQLRPWAKNPRKNDPNVPRVKRSLLRFGFVNPIVVWLGGNRMVAGHTRLKAAMELFAENPTLTLKGAPGPGFVRVVFHEFDSELDADAYGIADNKLAEGDFWDMDLLREHLARLSAEDRVIVGMQDVVIDQKTQLNEDVPPPVPAKPESRLGDLYILGRHRVLCGDATKTDDIKRLMNGELATLLWTDPPYNVNYEGKTKAALKIENDKMDDASFRAFLVDSFKAFDAVMIEGAVFYIAHADLEGYNFRGAVRDVGWKFAENLIWAKDAFVLGRHDYHWQHEPMLYGWKQGAGHHRVADRTQSTIWEFPRPHRNEDHPTMKPPELIERAINNSTKKDGIVLDEIGRAHV